MLELTKGGQFWTPIPPLKGSTFHADPHTGGCPADFTLTGVLANGGAAPLLTISSGASFTTETPVGYSGLNSFTLNWLDGNSLNIDTIVVGPAAAVPLPATAWMLLAGLGALGVARRRRTKA